MALYAFLILFFNQILQEGSSHSPSVLLAYLSKLNFFETFSLDIKSIPEKMRFNEFNNLKDIFQASPWRR